MAATDVPSGDGGCRRNPVEHVLDLVVFAPLGFLADSRALLPQLAESGRQQLNQRVQLARLIGQFAVQEGQRQAGKIIGNLRPDGGGAAADSDATAAPSGAAAPAATTANTPASMAPADDEAVPAVAEPAAPAESDATVEALLASGRTPEEGELAIPSYNSLAASQVVSRLEGLTVAELEAVRRYEEAHRGRRTVLGKIALLQSPS
jgi:hypothetical protein